MGEAVVVSRIGRAFQAIPMELGPGHGRLAVQTARDGAPGYFGISDAVDCGSRFSDQCSLRLGHGHGADHAF